MFPTFGDYINSVSSGGDVFAIWTDGRELPKDSESRWYGYSVGRWQDDYTFVVDTVGLDERTWLDNAGDPHSDQMRVEETYHRVDQNTLELTVKIDDPKAYTKPWTIKLNQPLAPDIELIDYICIENEKDVPHLPVTVR